MVRRAVGQDAVLHVGRVAGAVHHLLVHRAPRQDHLVRACQQRELILRRTFDKCIIH